MNIKVIAKDSTGYILHMVVLQVANWQEACRYGMKLRNELVTDGIRVEWNKCNDYAA